MQFAASDIRLSPTDLSAFLGCRHRTGLDLGVLTGQLSRPAETYDPVIEALRRRGAEHERAYVASLRAQGLRVVEIDAEQPRDARVGRTVAAMRDGAEAIVQAALQQPSAAQSNSRWTVPGSPEGPDLHWAGYADILRRVDTPSPTLGLAWSYEPYDTKLARDTRGSTILQLAVYVDLLEQIQGVRPARFHVVSPGGAADARFVVHTYRYADFAAYIRVVRRQLDATLALGPERIQQAHYPEPVEQCDICKWWDRCDARRRTDDHLGFVAGIATLHREELRRNGIATMSALAAEPPAFTPKRGSRDTYARLHHQARVQVESRTRHAPVHELLPVTPGEGLCRLPAPLSIIV